MPKHLHSHWLVFLGTVILVLIVAAPILTYPMGRDQGMYANIGRAILRGGVPFIDMWDIKPPPIYYIYAMGIALFGVTTEAIRAIDLALVPFGMLGLYLLGGEMQNKRPGILAAVLYGAFYFNDGFQNLSQSDSLATIPTIWAAYATFKASQGDSGSRQAIGWSLVVGLISGVLLWFKPQQYALVVSALVVYHIITRLIFSADRAGSVPTQRPFSSHLLSTLAKEGIAFAVGGVITGSTLLLYFWSQGMIAEILIVAEGTSAYNAQGYDLYQFAMNMRSGFYFRWLVWHGLIILAGIWIVAYIVNTLVQRDISTKSRDSSRLLVLWWVAGLGFAFVQAKGFDTHWFPMLPPMAVMGAWVLDRFINRFETQSHRITVLLYSMAVIAILLIPTLTTWGGTWPYLSNQESQIDYWDSFQANDLKPEESLQVARFLRERVAVGDTLFIWGFRPEVYFMAELVPATRFQAHFPLVAPWYPVEWQQHNVDILWAAMPPYVLVLEDDYMPWVTDFDADSHTLLQDYTELNNWLIANYERDSQIGDFIIWRQRNY